MLLINVQDMLRLGSNENNQKKHHLKVFYINTLNKITQVN